MTDETTLTRRRLLHVLGTGAAGALWPLHGRAAADRPRPDIVIIMADDMGYSDIGCYGGEIRTANLDRLAARGLRFTQFYNTARCCPSRASLLTGLYAHQTGIGHMTGDKGYEGYRGDLNGHCLTIAQVLRTAGYGTYISGKWHVTRHTRPQGPRDNWPLQRGFDRYFGTLVGAGSFWTPKALTRDNEPIEPPGGDWYYTHAISDHAARFIRDHARSHPDKPLFLYTAYTAPHWPLHAPRQDIERYRGQYLAGWARVRQERYGRMVRMGLIKDTWSLSPADEQAPDWDALSEDKKREMDLRMATYAAQIECMDHGVGRIVDALRESGRLDNTLILFLSDNGGCAEGGPLGFERKKNGAIGADTSFASYGLAWANVSNTPFRRYKHVVHEGGIATPLIAHWPRIIRAPGALTHVPAHIIDLMATCVDVAGAAYPETVDGTDIYPLEGTSLGPVFNGADLPGRALFWEHEGNRAVRHGDWKLVARGKTGPWELYNLAADRTELHDLAVEQPERVERLAAAWQAWAERCHVLPLTPKARDSSSDVGSKAVHFELVPGAVLPQRASPRVRARPFRIEALLRAVGSGVIVAQGGSRVGYALHVQDGRLAFTVRSRQQPVTVVSPERLPPGPITVAASLDRHGTAVIEVNGEPVARSEASLLHDMPTEGVEVGRDDNGLVGPYTTANPYTGTLESVIIDLE